MNEDFYNEYWSAENPPPESDPTTQARKARLAAVLAPLPSGAKALDLGCGRGVFTAFLAGRGFAATGMDLARVAVESARKRHPGVPFEVLAENGRIPAEDATFDAVWSSEVIEHIFDVHAHLSEINRVLKPGGLYILTTPYHGRLKNLLVCLTKFDHHFDPEGSHIRFFDKRGLQRCLVRAGFQPTHWSGIGRIWKLYRTWFVVAHKTDRPLPGRSQA